MPGMTICPDSSAERAAAENRSISPWYSQTATCVSMAKVPSSVTAGPASSSSTSQRSPGPRHRRERSSGGKCLKTGGLLHGYDPDRAVAPANFDRLGGLDDTVEHLVDIGTQGGGEDRGRHGPFIQVAYVIDRQGRTSASEPRSSRGSPEKPHHRHREGPDVLRWTEAISREIASFDPGTSAHSQ